MEAQCLSWPLIEFACHPIQLTLRQRREVSSFREVLSQQTVGVLIASSLPRTAWITEVDRHVGSQVEVLFSGSLWAYAVMSNHLHVVVQVLPDVAAQWSDREVAERWVRLFPREDLSPETRADVLCMHTERIALLRARLSDLSWFMRCLSEPIARRANKEDTCTGRFWEGRFKNAKRYSTIPPYWRRWRMWI